MKVFELINTLENSDRVRIYKDGQAQFINWAFEFKENHDKYNLSGEETVEKFRATVEKTHKEWKKRGLTPPTEIKIPPRYIAGDMNISLYYDIYI